MTVKLVQRDTPDRSYMQHSVLACFEGAARSACHNKWCIVLSFAISSRCIRTPSAPLSCSLQDTLQLVQPLHDYTTEWLKLCRLWTVYALAGRRQAQIEHSTPQLQLQLAMRYA